MSNFTLLYFPEIHTNFTCVFIESILKEYFNIEPFDYFKTYDSNEYALTIDSVHFEKPEVRRWINNNKKLIIDNLWDNDIFTAPEFDNNILILKSPNWSLWNESLWYKFLNYPSLNMKRIPEKFFLMMMHLKKPHRDLLFNSTSKYHSESVVSYVSEGILLNNDIPVNDISWQRYTNIEWYNTTNFSLVAESTIQTKTFLSEKTFKPIAFKQPFLIFGSPYTLKYLHDLGFETYENIIDESYDNEINNSVRFAKILEQLSMLYILFNDNKRFFSDKLTLEKIEHNYNLFYDSKLISQMIQNELIDPMLTFLNY